MLKIPKNCRNHSPHIWLHYWQFTLSSFSLIYMFSRRNPKWNERACHESPFPATCLWFRQQIEIARSQISKKKLSIFDMFFRILTTIPLWTYLLISNNVEKYWKHFSHSLCNKTHYENFKICLKKRKSSYCSWNL